mgnify:CR=1 FL=1
MLDEFRSIIDPRKIIEQGEQIGVRTYYNHKVVLYRMGLQLAEVHYEPESNQIDKVCSISFEDALSLSPPNIALG